MKLVAPLVKVEGEEKVAYVDPKSLSKDEKKLVKAIDEGQAAEAQLVKALHKELDASTEYNSAEVQINADKGSYLRLAAIDGAITEDGKKTEEVLTSELVNGHMTEAMQELRQAMLDKVAESQKEEAEV